MTTKAEARAKIDAAARACDSAHKSWANAVQTLSGAISINGFGIFHDPQGVRAKFLTAKDQLQEALRALEGVDWPQDADYDRF